MLCTLIGLLSHAIHEHSSRSPHTYICVNYIHIFMLRQVCAIEPSFFNATSGMHRRPFKGRHLVLLIALALHLIF